MNAVQTPNRQSGEARKRPGGQTSGVAGVKGSTAPVQGAGPGSSPRAAFQEIKVVPVPNSVARAVIERHHYLHSIPGGTDLTFGVFTRSKLRGALVLGVGPTNAHRLVGGATQRDSLALTRFWLADDLPRNSESRVLGIVMRALKQNTRVKFLVSYADPAQGHLGTIYQATGWLYTGISSASRVYDLGDGVLRHSRTVGQVYGTHSMKYFRANGIPVEATSQGGKHRYLYFLDRTWQGRLLVPVLPYPRKEIHQ